MTPRSFFSRDLSAGTVIDLNGGVWLVQIPPRSRCFVSAASRWGEPGLPGRSPAPSKVFSIFFHRKLVHLSPLGVRLAGPEPEYAFQSDKGGEGPVVKFPVLAKAIVTRMGRDGRSSATMPRVTCWLFETTRARSLRQGADGLLARGVARFAGRNLERGPGPFWGRDSPGWVFP